VGVICQLSTVVETIVPLASFRIVGSTFSGAAGAGGDGSVTSSGMRASAPRASNNSACLVLLLLPSFMPEPLNAGARLEAGAGDALLRIGEGSVVSNR
jgi:hypothetical protein